MSEPIELSFRYSAADVSRAMRSHYASRLHPRRDIIIVLVCLIVAVALWRMALHGFALFLFGAAAVFLLILAAALVFVPLAAFQLQPKFRDKYALTFTAQGIHFRTEHIDSQIEWDLYTRAKIDPNSYLLYYGPESFTIIPKRVFAGPEQLKAFEELISQKMLGREATPS